MRTLNKPVIFLLFSLISLTLKSQCYINLGDYSGATPQSTSFFEADACDLRSVFPDIAKFAVYDFGFYTETEPMAGSEGYESFLTVAKSQIHHDYYLLFARINTPSGLNQRIIVEFKFPFEETAFNCLIEDDIKNFRLYLTAYCNDQLNKSGSADLAIQNTIIKYKKFIEDKKECCVTGLTFSCSSALTDEELEKVYNDLGYYNIVGSISNVISNQTNIGTTFSSDVSCSINNYNCLEVLLNVHNELNKYVSTVIHFNVNNLAGTTISNSNNNNAILNIHGVIQKMNNNTYKGFINVKSEPGKGPGHKLWFVKLPNVTLSDDMLKADVKNHFKTLCGSAPTIEVIDGDSNPASKLNTTNYSNTDHIIVIGETASNILNFLKKNQTLCSFDCSGCGIADDLGNQVLIERFNKTRSSKTGGFLRALSVEISEGLCSHINIVDGFINYSQLPSHMIDFKTNSKTDLIGYLSVHVMGHNSIIGTHQDHFYPNHFMADGEGIKHFMSRTELKNTTNCPKCFKLTDLYNFNNYTGVKELTVFDALKEKLCAVIGE
ncbi:MAG: hypothetical protein IPK88_17965 [Saprospiraceae bacterium]|nr:hypothetical protein [Candidatus Defluviibacterium haderslevense]